MNGIFQESKERVEGRGRRTATRPTKADAQAWAVAEEAAILAGTHGEYPSRTLAEALARYRLEVTDKKPAGVSRADDLRFDAWLRDYPDLVGKIFHKIIGEDLAAWRDARLKMVSGSSVLREAQQLRPIWTLAVRLWKWAGQSPWKDIKLPAKGHSRRRVGG